VHETRVRRKASARASVGPTYDATVATRARRSISPNLKTERLTVEFSANWTSSFRPFSLCTFPSRVARRRPSHILPTFCAPPPPLRRDVISTPANHTVPVLCTRFRESGLRRQRRFVVFIRRNFRRFGSCTASVSVSSYVLFSSVLPFRIRNLMKTNQTRNTRTRKFG